MKIKSLHKRLVALFICWFILPILCSSCQANATDPFAGLYTYMTMDIQGENGVVTGILHNSFTFYSGNLSVRVELYSSKNEISYQRMSLVASCENNNFRTGEVVFVSAPTGGEQKYWVLRVLYTVDGVNKKEMYTFGSLFDENANALPLPSQIHNSYDDSTISRD